MEENKKGNLRYKKTNKKNNKKATESPGKNKIKSSNTEINLESKQIEIQKWEGARAGTQG